MTSQSPSVYLLILTSRAEEAADLITTLRTGGIPARGMYTDQCERLVELTASADPVDIILCCAHDPAIEMGRVMSHYADIEGDVPLVLIAEAGGDHQPLLQALRDGARDLVDRRQIERLQLSVARELADLQARQQLAHAEAQLAFCEQRVSELVANAEEAIAFVHEGMLIQTNAAYQRRFGFASAEDLDGLPILDLVAPEHHRALRELLRREDEANSDTEETMRLACLRADGSTFSASFTISGAEFEGARCLRLTVEEAGQESGGNPVQIDSETGLPNRAVLVDELSKRLNDKNNGQPVSLGLLYVGINSFSEVIQATGPLRALKIAAQFGRALEQVALTHSAHLLARFADDSFVLLLRASDQSAAKQLAVAVRREVRLPVSLPQRDTARPDCITGLAWYEGGKLTAAELIEMAYADAHGIAPSGLTERPAAGVATGTPTPSTAAPAPEAEPSTDVADREIAEKIDEALNTGGFKLVFQPIISLLGDSQENYSVLVRLLDEAQRLHEAREIIGPAVRTGRVEAIDRWVIAQAIKEVSAQRQSGQKINFFINLAESTFHESKLLLWICDRLRESEARGNWLTFQFQEVHARQNLAELAKVSDGLKKIKSRIALSRFGHDEQPETLLQTLQVDFVLFAPDFAQELGTDQGKQERLRDLANLAREFNVKTVVTGVEDAATLTVLWGAGIDYVQGNFLQRPSAVLALDHE